MTSSAAKESDLFRPNSEFITRKITQVNEKYIYQINIDDCPRYISVNINIEYIGAIYNDQFHVFKLTDGAIPEDFQAQFAYIDEEKINILSGKLKLKTKTYDNIFAKEDIIDSLNNIPDFLFISTDEFECIDFKNLDTAKIIIEQLNVDLHRTCPNFSLNIDYVFSLSDPSIVTTFTQPSPLANTILLCLFNGNNCVSSLELELYDDILSISSRTNELYQERKFNKLLRSVIIIIAKAIVPSFNSVESLAVNATSAYLMLHSFNAVYIDSTNQIVLDKNSSYEDIKAVRDKPKIIISRVELNDENIQNAVAVFNETIGRVNCGPLIATATNAKAKGLRSRRHSKKHNKKHNKSFIKKRFKDDSLY